MKDVAPRRRAAYWNPLLSASCAAAAFDPFDQVRFVCLRVETSSASQIAGATAGWAIADDRRDLMYYPVAESTIYELR